MLTENLEMRNMLRNDEDKMGAVLKIVAGAGGTEAQDWYHALPYVPEMVRDPRIQN